jgi:hypothetical protein
LARGVSECHQQLTIFVTLYLRTPICDAAL